MACSLIPQHHSHCLEVCSKSASRIVLTQVIGRCSNPVPRTLPRAFLSQERRRVEVTKQCDAASPQHRFSEVLCLSCFTSTWYAGSLRILATHETPSLPAL